MTAANDSERFVHDLCRRSFLSLWSIENPLGPKKKELCDALLVMGNRLVVVSVKDCAVTRSGNERVDVHRWQRRAVESSVTQLGGATRALERMTEVRRRDNPSVALALPPKDQRRLHLIAIALGGDDRVPIASGNHECGFVHVFDRETTTVVLEELDTVSDFVGYLSAKEAFATRAHCIMQGGEKDLLALFLREGRKFPEEPDALLLADGLWDQVRSDSQFARRKEADRVSYAWDRLVEEFAGHLRGGTLIGDVPTSYTERALRYMALENRLSRRALGDAFLAFLRDARTGRVGSRTIPAPSGVVYLFAACPRKTSPEVRASVLHGYCAILREMYPDESAIVGIITEIPDQYPEHSFGLMVIDEPLDDDTREIAAEARERGILGRLASRRTRYQEYPDGD